MITQNLLLYLFDYINGELFWKVKPSHSVDITKPAGCLHHTGLLAHQNSR